MNADEVMRQEFLVEPLDVLREIMERPEVLQIGADAYTWTSILLALQLALSHPQFDGSTAQRVDRFAHDLAAALSKDEAELFLLETGFDRSYDTTREDIQDGDDFTEPPF